MTKNLIDGKDHSDARILMARQVLTLPLRAARTFLVIPLLTPEIMFLLKLINTWFSYLPRVTMGTHAVLYLFYPEAEASGDEQLGLRYRLLAWRFSLLGTFAGGIMGAVLAYIYVEKSMAPLLVVWGIFVVPNAFAINYFQAAGHFRTVARVGMVAAISGFVLSYAGLLCFDLWGYVAGSMLSVVFTAFLSRGAFFPPDVSLPFAFVKATLFSGSHLWCNGLLNEMSRNYEITLFVFVTAGSSSFAGQYAVAMTLVGLQHKITTAVIHVFQRKLVMWLKTEERGYYEPVYKFAVFNFFLFVLSAMGTLLGTHLLVYLLPDYPELVSITPLLLLGSLLLRLNIYPTVVFRADRQMHINTLSHGLHLVVGSCCFMILASIPEAPLALIALSQVIGATVGTLYQWVMFLLRKQKNSRRFPSLMLLIGLAMVWLIAYYLTLNFLPLAGAILFGGGILLLLMARFIFPVPYALFLDTLMSWFRRKRA